MQSDIQHKKLCCVHESFGGNIGQQIRSEIPGSLIVSSDGSLKFDNHITHAYN